MLPGPGSTSGNVDSTANRTPRRIFRRPKEKMNPHNIEFVRTISGRIPVRVCICFCLEIYQFFLFIILQQRRVAALQARQEERSKMYIDLPS